MTRRHILAAPIAALFGSTIKPSAGDMRYSPRATVGDILGGQFFPATNFYNWRPILEQINLMPDPREGRV